MKLKKNLAAAVLAAAMVASLATPVFAEDGIDLYETKSSDTTEVKYTVSESYTWSVPSEIDFTKNETVTTSGTTGNTQNVQVTKSVITPGKKLQIKINESSVTADKGGFGIKTTGVNGKIVTLAYEVKAKEGAGDNYTKTLNVGDSVLEVKAGDDTGMTELQFTLKKADIEQAGTYTGTLTYTASVVDQTAEDLAG